VKRRNLFVVLVLALSMMMLVTSCDKREGDTPNYEITNISASVGTIYADNSEAIYSDIFVQVENNGSPAENVNVNFSSNYGSLPGVVATNASGVAVAKFVDNGVAADAVITASVGEEEVTVGVKILPAPSFVITNIQSDVDSIYADNGITTANISIIVRDQENFAVTGETVLFRSTDVDTGDSFGNIFSNIRTDSTGVVTTTFWDQGDIGNAKIEAFVGSDTAFVMVRVADQPQLVDPIVQLNNTTPTVASVNGVEVFVNNVYGFVPDGTAVTLIASKGEFQDGVSSDQQSNSLGGQIEATTVNGRVTAFLNVGTTAGTGTITATLDGFVGSTDFTVLPGLPTQLVFEEYDATPIMAGSGDTRSLTVTLKDLYGNSVGAGKTVAFETNIGNLSLETTGTDPLGQATTVFSPGISAGSVEIKSTYQGQTGGDENADAVLVEATGHLTVNSSGVNSIRFATNTEVTMQVAQTGGVESYEAVVNLFDLNGNQVDDDVRVWFKLLNAPVGTNINQEVFNVYTDSTSVLASNGQASISVNSGIESGPIAIQASIVADETHNYIMASKANIVVVAGPPAQILVSIGDNNTGEDMGSGVWKVEVSATVIDQWNNPVQPGTVVYFSIPEDEQVDPEYDSNWGISIDPAAFVGNENADGDTVQGVAFTSVTYDGSYSMKNIVFKALTSNNTGGNVEEFSEIILPFHDINLDIAATPQHLDWVTGDNPNEKVTLVRVEARDGQATPIDDLVLVFYGTLGHPMMENSMPFDADIYTETTGTTHVFSAGTGLPVPYTPYAGRVYKEWGFFKDECPAPTPAGPGTTTGTVTVQVLGDNTQNNTTIILFRYIP